MCQHKVICDYVLKHLMLWPNHDICFHIVYQHICHLLVTLLSGTCHKSAKLSGLMNDGILAQVGVLTQRTGGGNLRI